MSTTKKRCVVLVALGLLGAGGCADVQDAGPADGSVTISRDTFEGEWPFTVHSGGLRCEGQAVIFSAEGTDYGVNGTAMDAGYPGVNPIWKPASDGSGLRVYIGDVIDRGLELCR